MSGINMEGEEDEEMQTLFQCKLCDFAGHTKGEIADHFISEHASIQVIESPVKSKRGTKEVEDSNVKTEVQSTDEEGTGLEEKTAEETPATIPVKKNSPRRTPVKKTQKSAPTKG